MKSFFTILVLLAVTGCGTIFMGEKQDIRIHSSANLDDAEIKINGMSYPHQKGVFRVDKKAEGLFITILKPQYYEKTQYADRVINPFALAGDFLWLIGAPVALAIDFYTGGFYQYEPSEISVTMRKKD